MHALHAVIVNNFTYQRNSSHTQKGSVASSQTVSLVGRKKREIGRLKKTTNRLPEILFYLVFRLSCPKVAKVFQWQLQVLFWKALFACLHKCSHLSSIAGMICAHPLCNDVHNCEPQAEEFSSQHKCVHKSSRLFKCTIWTACYLFQEASLCINKYCHVWCLFRWSYQSNSVWACLIIKRSF